MSIEALTILAARKKWRFVTAKGHLSFEDLWDLKLEDLDKIAVALDEKIQKGGRKSFIAKRSESLTEEQGMFDLVKYVIETKMAEADAAKTRTAKASQRAFLLEIREKQQIRQLESLSPEELDKQIAALSE